MRYFKSNEGVVGFLDDQQALIDDALASGLIEVQSLNPGAMDVVWTRPDGTISIATVMPQTLAELDFARTMLALDKPAAADGLAREEAALGAIEAEIAAAETTLAQGKQAVKLRLQGQAAMQARRDHAAAALVTANDSAIAAVANFEARDAELLAIINTGAQAQTALAEQQARRQQGIDTGVAAKSAVALAAAAMAQADRTLGELQQVVATGTAAGEMRDRMLAAVQAMRDAAIAVGNVNDPAVISAIALLEGEIAPLTAKVDAGALAAEQMAATVTARQNQVTALEAAQVELAAAERMVVEADGLIGGLLQTIAQVRNASAERDHLAELMRTRRAQDDADATAIRARLAEDIARMEEADTALNAIEQAGIRAEAEIATLQTHRDLQIERRDAARATIDNITKAEGIAATLGTSITDHPQVLQARGEVPGDWAVAAIHSTDIPYLPDWPRREDMVFDAANGAVVVDMTRARETTRERLRSERAPLLAALDVQFMRNLELGTDNGAVVAEKNRLRDITKLPDGCATVEELRGVRC